MIYIKNNSNNQKTFRGIVLNSGEYYLIPQSERIYWHEDETIFDEISNGDAVIASDNDGTKDIESKPEQWNYLGGEYVQKTAEVIPKGGDLVTDRGFSFVATANSTTVYDYIVNEDLFLQKGFLISHGYNIKDTACVSIVHPVEGVVHDYVKDFPLKPFCSDSTIGLIEMENKAITETNFNGFIIRVTYVNNTGLDLDIAVGIKAYS